VAENDIRYRRSLIEKPAEEDVELFD
jgi:hypothetical protein